MQILRASRLCLGEYLSEAALTSPSHRFRLENTRAYGTRLIDSDSDRVVWAAPDENVYGASWLVMGLDGDLMVWNHHREPGWHSGTAGHGVQELRVSDAGEVVLLDHTGQIVWSTADGTQGEAAGREGIGGQAQERRGSPGQHGFLELQGAPEQTGSGERPRQDRLERLFDSLAPAHGYTAAVVSDTTPEQALRRWGLAEESMRRATWQEFLPDLDAEDQVFRGF